MDNESKTLDPAAVFETPERLRDSPELSTARKIELLERWAYEDSDMSVATEEGMPGGDQRDLQQRILMALQALGADVDLEQIGPSKQHGLPIDRRK